MIPFLQLTPGEDASAVRAAVERVITRGWFVLGPEVDAFEREFAAASGAAEAVGVGTGTDALAIALRALGSDPETKSSRHHCRRDSRWRSDGRGAAVFAESTPNV